MSLQATPRGERLHIAFFGKRNSGKSSLFNALTGQPVSLVSDVAGTTTDPVYKAMELFPLGPCSLIDTAGFDDLGKLGMLRVSKTEEILKKTDIAVLVCSDLDLAEEVKWHEQCKQEKLPVLFVISKADIRTDLSKMTKAIRDTFGEEPLIVSAKTGEGIEWFPERLARLMPEDFSAQSLTGHLVSENDLVLLVMPQDIQAPKGRLILPQVQTIRDLLDRHCMVLSVTTDKLANALEQLKAPPSLIITDSQVFGEVFSKKPKESKLSSFSVLFARYKGDLAEYVKGAEATDSLSEHSRVLIAEACTHSPKEEDIGRVKIPRLLRKKYGAAMQIDIVSGTDFPTDLSGYDLVIHCGGCMFHRRYILSRIAQAKKQKVPITNYGIFLAKMSGILEQVDM